MENGLIPLGAELIGNVEWRREPKWIAATVYVGDYPYRFASVLGADGEDGARATALAGLRRALVRDGHVRP